MLSTELKPIFLKIRRYCAQSERCQKEVSDKLKQWGLNEEEIEVCIELLVAENFIDHLRYSNFFASDKFRFQKWGRLKIIHALKAKGISSPDYESAIRTQIDEGEYLQTLELLTVKKLELLSDISQILPKKQKLLQYLLQKGYEPELIHKTIRSFLP